MTSGFERELFALYPEISVESGLEKAGIDLLDVGYNRIHKIKHIFEDRANAAGKRIMQKARDNKLFTIDASNYDGSVSMEQMGALTPEEERAYLKARNHYLEEMLLAQKKSDSNWRSSLPDRRTGNLRRPF